MPVLAPRLIARFFFVVLLFALFAIMAFGTTPAAATPTPTPEARLRIHGTVRPAHQNGPGLPGVEIFQGFAGPGPMVAITDSDGDYQTKDVHLDYREHVIVYAELKGYTLDPQQVEWEQETGYVTDKEINFVARPLATTCATPPPITVRLLVSMNQHETYSSTVYIYIYVGMSSETNIDGILTIEGPKGAVTLKAHLDIWSGVNIEVPLATSTVNYFTVYGQFGYGPGCSYITSTQYDTQYSRLAVLQRELPPTSATTSPTP